MQSARAIVALGALLLAVPTACGEDGSTTGGGGAGDAAGLGGQAGAGLGGQSGTAADGAPEAESGGASGANSDASADADGGPASLFDCSPSSGTIPALQLTQVAKLARPLIAESPPLDPNRLVLGEQRGVLRVMLSGALLPVPFLDISDRVFQVGSEQGLLGLAFHPAYAENGRFYLNYTANGVTAPEGSTVISEFTRGSDPDLADASSERVLLTVAQPQANHNGGALVFRDGLLFIGLGDGGNVGDSGPGHAPGGNAQALDTLLGKLLRIDVDSQSSGLPYGIPAGNMSGAGVRGEIWSYGLRNPYRFSVDPCTRDLYLADVGQNTTEEVNVEPAAAASGRNYGWRVMEGSQCYNAASCDKSGKTLPVAEYDHSAGCSIIGGHVYRGAKIPGLRGYYLYADYCSGRFWALRWDGSSASSPLDLSANLNPGAKTTQITSFGRDAAGELYVMSLTYGFVFRIEAS